MRDGLYLNTGKYNSSNCVWQTENRIQQIKQKLYNYSPDNKDSLSCMKVSTAVMYAFPLIKKMFPVLSVLRAMS